MDYNITSIVDSWSVRCMKEGTNVASTFVIDESGLSFITSDNLNGFIVSEGAVPNLLKGVWEFDASPIIPEAEDNNSPTPLRQVVRLIDDSEKGMTLQKAYDNYDTEPDGQLNGFTGTTPTEFRVGNAVLKLNQGNLTISLRDELNDYVTAGIDLTDGVISLYGNVRVPDTIETSHPNSAVNLTKLFYELESLLMSDNTWTKNNVFKNGLQSEKDPELDADVANKKYVDTKLLSGIASSIVPLKTDLDTFEEQAHTWSAENVFTGPVTVTEPVNDNNPTTKGYVDRADSELSESIERVERESKGRDELINEAFDALKDDVDTFETQDHSWSGVNTFNGKTKVSLDPSDGVDVANKKYVDSVAATRSPWQGALNLSASDTTTLPIYTDVYKSYQWRIGTGSIVVNGVTYANGDLVIANEDIKGTEAKPVSKFSFFNGQDADVVKTTESQTVSNKTITNTNLSATDNVYREATPTQDGTVVLAEVVESGNGGVVTSGLLADQGYVDKTTIQGIDALKALRDGLLFGSYSTITSPFNGGLTSYRYTGYHLRTTEEPEDSILLNDVGPLRIDRYLPGTDVLGSLIFPEVAGEETIATVKNISDIFVSDNTWTGVQTFVGDLHINAPEADPSISPAIVLNDSSRLTLPEGKNGTFALKEDVVSLSGAETITGEKNFTVSPSVPTAELDTNDNTAASTAFVKGCVDVVDSKKASLLYTDPKTADNNANAYGTIGTLKAYGAFGDAISVESITVTRGEGSAPNVDVDLWCRLLKSTGTSWVVVAQSVEPRRWSEVSDDGDLEFKMANVSHDLPSESDKVAVVFVNSDSAEAHSSTGPLRFRTTSSYRGSLSNAITSNPSDFTGANYSPRVKFGFISMAKGASVHIEGAETITGAKTFANGININGKTLIEHDVGNGVLKFSPVGSSNQTVIKRDGANVVLQTQNAGNPQTTWTLPGGKTGTVAMDADVVHLSGVETITGNKTFSGSTTLNGSVTINQNATVKGLNIENKTFISNIIDAGELKVTHHGQNNGFIARTVDIDGDLHRLELLTTNGTDFRKYDFPLNNGTVVLDSTIDELLKTTTVAGTSPNVLAGDISLISNGATIAGSGEGNHYLYTKGLEGSKSVRSLAYNGSVFVAALYKTSGVAYSYDGINWVSFTDKTTGTGRKVIHDGTRFILSCGPGNFYSSTDGISWTALTSLTNGLAGSAWESMATDGTYTAFGSTKVAGIKYVNKNDVVSNSTITFNTVDLGGQTINAIDYLNGYWFIGTTSDGAYITADITASVDTWTHLYAGVGVYSFTYSEKGQFYYIATDGFIYRSSDATTGYVAVTDGSELTGGAGGGFLPRDIKAGDKYVFVATEDGLQPLMSESYGDLGTWRRVQGFASSPLAGFYYTVEFFNDTFFIGSFGDRDGSIPYEPLAIFDVNKKVATTADIDRVNRNVVHVGGDETITGRKTFSTGSPTENTGGGILVGRLAEDDSEGLWALDGSGLRLEARRGMGGVTTVGLDLISSDSIRGRYLCGTFIQSVSSLAGGSLGGLISIPYVPADTPVGQEALALESDIVATQKNIETLANATGQAFESVEQWLNILDGGKANDADVVHLSGNETITGAKTFSLIRLPRGSKISLLDANVDVIDVDENLTVTVRAINAIFGGVAGTGSLSVLPLGTKTALGADAYGLHVSATGGLQLFGTHFLRGDIWTDSSLKIVANNVSLYSTDEAAIGFDYANEVTFRTMPNDGKEATYKFESWQWDDEAHTSKSPSAGVLLLKPSQVSSLMPDSVLNMQEGDARWKINPKFITPVPGDEDSTSDGSFGAGFYASGGSVYLDYHEGAGSDYSIPLNGLRDLYNGRNNLVHLTGTETISGLKSFKGGIRVSSIASISGTPIYDTTDSKGFNFKGIYTLGGYVSGGANATSVTFFKQETPTTNWIDVTTLKEGGVAISEKYASAEKVYTKAEIDGVDTGADTVIKMNEIYGYLNDYETFAGEELPLELYSEVVAEFQRWQENPNEVKEWVTTRNPDGTETSTNPYRSAPPTKPVVDFNVSIITSNNADNPSFLSTINQIVFVPNAKTTALCICSSYVFNSYFIAPKTKYCRYMLFRCYRFNKPLSLPNTTNCDNMLAYATAFNSVLDLPKAENCLQMLYGATAFNQPLSLPSATNCSQMLRGAKEFNQTLSLPNAIECGHMLYEAISFNQPLNLPSATRCPSLLLGATAFNQTLSIPNATSCNYLLSGATSFNRPLSLPKCSEARSAFANTAMSAENISATLDSLPTWTDGAEHVITFTGSPGAAELTQESTSVANAVARGWTVEL